MRMVYFKMHAFPRRVKAQLETIMYYLYHLLIQLRKLLPTSAYDVSCENLFKNTINMFTVAYVYGKRCEHIVPKNIHGNIMS